MNHLDQIANVVRQARMDKTMLAKIAKRNKLTITLLHYENVIVANALANVQAIVQPHGNNTTRLVELDEIIHRPDSV